MGNRSLFPVVAVPLAFFCTLFFRHRKKSVSAPWGGKSLSAPESARQAPPRGNFLGRGFALRSKQGGFPLAPLHPLRIANRSNRAPHMAASPALAPESARQAPPKGNFFGKVVSCHASRGLSVRPLHPFGKSACQWDKRICAYGHTKWLSSGQTIGEALTQREPP